MVINIREYTKVIHRRVILEDISLTLTSGHIYGLRGVNGSGKTMLIRAICGLIFPTSGKISIDGAVLGKDISFPPSVGVLIEAPAFLPNQTGFHNLQMIASLKGIASDEMIRNTLKNVGLDPEDRRTYRKYSLGMKQKLGIAAALMEQPDLLILDEPFNALDEKSAKKIRELILREKERGTLVILACHDLSALETISDVVIVIEEGRIAGIQKPNTDAPEVTMTDSEGTNGEVD